MKKLHASGITAIVAAAVAFFALTYAHQPNSVKEDSSRGREVPIAASIMPSSIQASTPSVPANLNLEKSQESETIPEATAPVSEKDSGNPANTANEAAVSRGLIYLDPGHQRKGDSRQEPISPNSSATKARVTGGTTGVSTGKPEYVLNLEVALLLKEALIKRGFEVLMTREDHEVNLSNVERAEMANAAHARLAVRIHADGNDSTKAKGYSVLYPDKSVSVTRSIQADSLLAAESILGALKAGTNASSRGLQPRKDLTGFNWSTVPVVLVEMGFMTNPSEDEDMSDPDYQLQLAESIAVGIELYMVQKED
ncbi:N-acetylmuramoyl-L-alanine amidase family protein [Paenibacillus radicis (ex Xue et al. 2023)]|uniref:N-acetylmuramoyl-L-alanine amidase n=1 Tax=Paenibacillus radicis (ex Xue et al. 2023) TaxID=2972489 RepID=A0ABT1YJH6_9BACL|nr:N-acetylmuramoyl-L-alanine amidase [Paenibacillus radicis (ex Xue et al. 2023)]MCR8633355.1 N-acetylmuramoyl-L-alanine amidase [Paenibacillus radicis (ex Xue et al. 2023)]